MPMEPRRAAPAIWLLALASGCVDAEVAGLFPTLPIRYETSQLRIGTSFEEPLCARDLRMLDAHVARVEAKLGVRGSEPRTLFLYESRPLPGCSPMYNGCFNPSTGIAAAVYGSAGHELVHSIAVNLGHPSDFWAEGLAE